jgi:hypothetical protein
MLRYRYLARLRRAMPISRPALLAAVAIVVGACSGSVASTAGLAAPTGAPAGVAAAPNQPASARDGTVESGSGGASATGGETAPSGNGVAADSGPLVVRTGSLALEVTDLDATLLQARARIIGLGGYVSDSERTNQGADAVALITYRIPADHWDEALDALHGLASKVVSEQTKAVEVTGQVLDLGARISNLQATERALQAIMAQATRTSDVLEVQNQLTQVQGEIEQLSTQKAHLADQAAMGTLAVTYSLPVVAVTQASSGWNLGAEFDRAVAQLLQLGQGLAVAAVWLIVVGLPVLVAVLLVVGLLVLLARRIGPRRPTTSGEPPAGIATTGA